MKTFISVALIFACTLATYSQEINFQNGTWAELKAKAKAENKYLFVDGMTDWCGWCKVMDKQTFMNAEVVSMMNKHFLAARIDMEKDYGITLAMKYRVSGFPTFLVFSPEGKLVYRIVGYMEAPAFMGELSNAMTTSKQQPSRGITEVMDLDYPDFYKKAFAGNGKRTFPDSTTVAAFFKTHTNWMDEVAFGVLMRFSTPDNVNQYFLDNIGSYRELYGSEPDDKLSSFVYAKMSNAVESKNEKELNEATMLIDKYMIANKDETKQSIALEFYSQTADWKNFNREFQKYLDKKGYENTEVINTYAWNIYEHCEDADVIASACTWMKKATDKDPQYAYLDTYAALLYKNKNYTEAKKLAKQAIESGHKEGTDVKATEELLLKIKNAQAK